MSKDELLARVAKLPPEKRRVLEERLRKKDSSKFRAQKISSKFDNHRIAHVEHEDDSCLSYAQERLWFFDKLEPQSSAYNIAMVFKIAGPLKCATLEVSLSHLMNRHDSLRTIFYEDQEGMPRQRITTSDSFALPIIILEDLDESNRVQQAAELMEQEARAPFSLETGPVARFRLIRLTEQHHWLFATFHHIIADRWSIDVFRKELTQVYMGLSRGEQSVLPVLPIRYADFIRWQRAAFTNGQLDEQLTYWKQQLAGANPFLQLPIDRPRALSESYHGGVHSVIFPYEIVKVLETLSQQHNVTLFMSLLAVFQALLFRYSGQCDMSIGTPVAGRSRVETEGLIGCFINTIVVRVNLSGNPSFSALLKHVRDVVLTGYDHQDLPFEKVVQELPPERHLSASPLFQCLFDFDHATPDVADLEGMVITQEYCETDIALFDLGLFIRRSGQGLNCTFEYNTNLFLPSTVERLGHHWQQLLQSVVDNPEMPIGQLSLLNKEERQQLLVEWNQTEQVRDPNQNVLQLIEGQAMERPAAVAVVCGEQQMSYQELNHQANQVAHYLRKQGVGPGVAVGLCVERSVEMVIALLAVLKTGGAYVPLDPTYPQERLAYILEDADVMVLVTQTTWRARLPESTTLVVSLDTEWDMIVQESDENFCSGATDDSLAYVIYTSGSTGKPKGVEIPHGAFVNLLQAMCGKLGLTSHDRWLAVTTIAFDIAGLELFGPLIAGGQVHLVSWDEALDGRRLMERLQSAKATVMQATPATWQMLRDTGWEGVSDLMMLCGGAALSRGLAEWLMPRGRALWNLYGPTETTIWSAVHRVEEVTHSIPIGQPIANTQLYVLDDFLQVLPIGVLGELCIGGRGLARGYRGRPDLTEEKFIDHPFNGSDAVRLYRTGDRVRRLPDGTMEFLGRVDHQVKVRGFRIELGEIEAVLGQHSAVKECVVVGHPNDTGEVSQLVAYIVITSEGIEAPTRQEFHQFLKATLPEYMFPSEFVVLDVFPLTPNGKIDRAQLPQKWQILEGTAETYVAPRTSLEHQLTTIWEDVLERQPIGMDDNFFDVGGHSLKAVQLFSKIEKKFGKALPLSILFKAPTIEKLCSFITHSQIDHSWTSLVPIQPNGSKPPFFLVHGVGGNVLTFANLTSILGSDQPLYGLQSVGLHSEEKIFDKIEDMAAFYLQEIQSVHPHGPYYLGGACMGGLVAFEMAQQLQGNGKDVAFLGLFDTWLPDRSEFNPYSNPRIRFLGSRLQSQIDFVKREGVKAWFPQALDKLKALPEMIHEGDVYKKEDKSEKARALVSAANFRAIKKYVPTLYNGKITYFEASARVVNPKEDTRMEWERFASGGVECFRTPASDTGDMFVFPSVQALAGHVKASLERAQNSVL